MQAVAAFRGYHGTVLLFGTHHHNLNFPIRRPETAAERRLAALGSSTELGCIRLAASQFYSKIRLENKVDSSMDVEALVVITAYVITGAGVVDALGGSGEPNPDADLVFDSDGQV